MAMSGIEVDPDIPTLFNEMKLRKTNKFVTFKIESKKRVVVDYAAEACPTDDKESDKEQFDLLRDLLSLEPRYILYDFSFTISDGRKIQKIAFIFWCPDDGKIGDKMIYASTKDTIKKTFSGLGIEFQCNDRGDLDYTTLSAEVEKKA